MDKARKKFNNKTVSTKRKGKKKGLSYVDDSSEKEIENELLEDDKENEATAPSDMFEPVSYDDGFDQFKEY